MVSWLVCSCKNTRIENTRIEIVCAIQKEIFFLNQKGTGTGRPPRSPAKPREGDGRRLGGGAERLSCGDVAAALLRGCAVARRTAEGAGAEALRCAPVAGGGGRIGTRGFRLLRFLVS
jgi:hypothetical protein